jgi:DNA-binding Xre family transcriptional regulator
MSDTAAVVGALKQALKGRGMTYRDVARGLGLSEASVKRLFSRNDFTLERLERVCALLELSLNDLLRLAEAGQSVISELTDAQERELMADRKLLLMAILVVNGWTYEQILGHYTLSAQEVVGYLVRLDRLKLIDLLPRNRIRLRISRNFTWRKGGAIEQYFEQQVAGEFLRHRFEGQNALRRFVFGVLSKRSMALLRRRLEQVVREFNDLHREDLQLPPAARRGTSLLLAARRWAPSVFADLERVARGSRG